VKVGVSIIIDFKVSAIVRLVGRTGAPAERPIVMPKIIDGMTSSMSF